MINPEFYITSLVVVLIPGTGVIYTVSSGLFLGWRASIAAAAGCTAGIIPHLLASILGLSAILHMSSIAFQVIKYAGAAYLLYLAWSMWRQTGSLAFDNSRSDNSLWQIACRGLFINILNPKLSLFFLAFLPQFVQPAAGSPLAQMLILSLIFMAMTLGIFILYGFSAHKVRSFMTNSPKHIIRLQRTFAATFAALGLRLATAEQ